MFEGKDVRVVLANAGTGKLEWVEQIIPTPQGFRRFGDLKVGDYVYSVNGKPTKVLGVYPHGYQDVYKVTFSDGRSDECGLEHLWGVYTRAGKKSNEWKYEVLELKKILARGVRGNDKRANRVNGTPRFYIPASPVIEGSKKVLPCDPYVLGSFIGNGCCTLAYLTLSSNDEWNVNKCASLLGCEVKRNICNYSWTFFKEGHLVRTADIIPESLACYAREKRIPSEYMFASIEQRKALLQGLFDTDGSVVTSGGRLHVSYSTTSEALCKDVRNLLLTFGIVSSVREDRHKEHTCYELRVNCSKDKAELLFSLPRKLDRVRSFDKVVRRDYTKVSIRSIEKLSVKKDTMCIYVEDDMHLYLTKDFIVTHNTRKIIDEVTKELEVRRPEEIAFVTFTRKGAEEGLRRICSKLMIEPDELPYFRTLHSLTFHALNLKADQMFGRLDQRKFNKLYGYNVNRSEVNTGKVQPTKDSAYLDFYDMERSGALTSRQLADADIEIGYYRQLVRKYEEYKASEHLVDFFDCLIKYVQEGGSLPCKVVYIDEAQDISALQWKVIEKAFSKAEKIVIVGDDKQAIFTYSGARPDFLIQLSKQFPVEHLSMSYRIPYSVYKLSVAITSFISEKTEQKAVSRPENGEGSITQLPDLEYLRDYIDSESIRDDRQNCQWYILARNNCFLDYPKRMLEENLIPYWTADGFFMGGEIMKRLKDYHKFRLEGYRDEKKKLDFQRRFGIEDFRQPFTDTNLFTEGRKWVYASYIEKYGLQKLEEMCKWNPQILVSTIHHVKGGEAKNVAIMLDTTGRTTGNIFRDVDEELRILYVGVTRTKQNLYLIDSRNGQGYDKILETIKTENGLKW